MSHPVLAVVVMICLGFAVAGLGLLAYVGWSLVWREYDRWQERRAKRRRKRPAVLIYSEPSHMVGRDYHREWKR